MINIINFFLIKKANFKDVEKILKKENFIYTKEDIDKILKGNQKGTRYGNLVLKRKESGEEIDRFIKVMIDGKWRTYKLFERQIAISEFIKKDPKYEFPSIEVIKKFLAFPIPYAILETRKSGEDYGFMNDQIRYYENFTDEQVKKLVKMIYSFHQIGKDVDREIWRYTIKRNLSLKNYKKECLKNLSIKIKHKKYNGEVVFDTVQNIISSYFKISNLKDRIFDFLDKNWIKQSSSEKYLIHADMAIDNVYKYKNGELELLDFEWVSNTTNPIVAIIYDYGNLRARAWSSSTFQQKLDKYMLEIGKTHFDEKIIKSGISLGKMIYSLMMSRFHLDFNNTIKKDKRTEEEYFNMFPKTLESLREVLL